MRTLQRLIFKRVKRDFEEYGLRGILGHYKNGSGVSYIEPELYKLFKKYYLTSQKLNSKEVISIIEEEMNASDKSGFVIPCAVSFERQLLKEYSKDEIARFRELIKPLEIANNKISETLHKTFSVAGKEYFESLNSQKDKASYEFTLSYYKTHVESFFNDFKIIEITEKILKEYKKQKINEGFSISSILTYLNLVRSIVKTSCPKLHRLRKSRTADSPETLKYLSLNDINNLLTFCAKHYEKFLPIIYIALSTGMTLSEILGLEWKFTDLENMKITVKNNLYNGKIIKHRSSNKIRSVTIDKTIKTILKNHQTSSYSDHDFVFGRNIFKKNYAENFLNNEFKLILSNAKIEDFDFLDLRHTCVYHLLKQNAPLAYIKKNLGFTTTDEIVNIYGYFLNEFENKNYNPLADFKINLYL